MRVIACWGMEETGGFGMSLAVCIIGRNIKLSNLLINLLLLPQTLLLHLRIPALHMPPVNIPDRRHKHYLNLHKMARVFRRLGTKSRKYMFVIQVHNVTIPVNKAYNIYVAWKRRRLYLGNKSSKTTVHANLSPENSYIEINESLYMLNTLYLKGTG